MNNKIKVETKSKNQKAITTTLSITFKNDKMKVLSFTFKCLNVIMNLRECAKKKFGHHEPQLLLGFILKLLLIKNNVSAKD